MNPQHPRRFRFRDQPSKMSPLGNDPVYRSTPDRDDPTEKAIADLQDHVGELEDEVKSLREANHKIMETLKELGAAKELADKLGLSVAPAITSTNDRKLNDSIRAANKRGMAALAELNKQHRKHDWSGHR